MITVAFDGRKYADYGIGTYVRRLLKGFSTMPDGPECTVFLGTGVSLGSAFPDTWRFQTVPYAPYGLGEFFRFGKEIRTSGRTLFHTPHYTTPLDPGLPTVVTIHDLIHLRFPEYFGPHRRLYARLMVGHACRTARSILTDSEATKRDLVEMIGAPESKIRVIPLGVDDDFRPASDAEIHALKERYALPDRYVIFVGNPKPHKGIDTLIEAIKPKYGLPKELTLVIAGGSDADAVVIRGLADRAGVSEKVRHLSNLPHGDLPVMISGARMLAMPSRWEGFGLPVLEAMACGTPVVCTSAGSLPEVAGRAAIQVKLDDPGALSEAMATVDRDEAVRSAMRREGLAHCRRFTWERTVSRTIEAYREAL
jgi:glycosyltransferase involved in cell wall biosynthesis